MDHLPDSPPHPPAPDTPPAAAEDDPHVDGTLAYDPRAGNGDASVADDEPSYPSDPWFLPVSPWQTLPQSGLSLLIAKPGVGATTLARTLAFWLARGRGFEPLWGDGTMDERVWYWMLTPRNDPGWEKRMAATFAPVADWEGNLKVMIGMPYRDPIVEMRDHIAGRKFIVLDALPDFHSVAWPADETSTILSSLRPIAEKGECSILGILPLSSREKITEDTAYLSQRIYGVETVFLLRNRSGTRTLTVTGAVGDEIGESVLHYDERTNRVAIGDAWREIAATAIVNRIREALKAGPCTERELEGRIGGKRAEIARALRDLVATEAVTRTGSGKRGDPYRYDWSNLPRILL